MEVLCQLVKLYLGENDKKNNVYLRLAKAHFSPQIFSFHGWFDQSLDVEPMDKKSQLCFHFNKSH
jgi:hypothetical protein